MDKIIVEYQLKTEELRKELGDVKKQLSDTEKQVETSGNKMSNSFKNVGKAIAAAFSVQMLIQFGRESVELARKADGVKRAFDRLNDPNLLNELRAATKGTVSDLQLMQNAVKANNFKIPLENMGTMLAFAAKQANDMGESVDYMVESITVGIARKSIPILDNLGISSAEIAEEMEKTGDFAEAVGNIMQRSMQSASNSALTAADNIAIFRAEIENTKVAIGEELIPVADASNKFILELVRAFSYLTESSVASIEGIEVITTAIDDLGDSAETAGGKMFDYLFAPFAKFLGTQKTIQQLQSELKILQDLLITLPIGSQGFIDTLNEINKIQKELNDALGRNSGFKKAKKDIEDLYPPVDALTTALDEFGKQFAFIRSQITEGIDVGLDLDRTAEAILNVEKSLQQLKDTNSEYVDTTQEAADWTQAWFDISSSAYQGLSAISDQQTQKYIDNLQAQFDAGQITQEQFDRLQDERLRKNARQQKSAAIFDIILSTAQAIMKALSLGNVPASVAAGVAGAIQLGVAVNAPVPAFAEGVVGLNGDGTETSDSILARLSKGESVITAKGTRQDKGLFEAANKMKLEEYINKNYVLPVLLKKQQEDKAMFDDYRLYRSLQDLRHSDKANTRMIVNAIKTEKVNSRRYWA
jgi:hypothetical protein